MSNESLETLIHYGVARKSGRYPWGSGEDPYQSSRSYTFLKQYEELLKTGMNGTEIAKKMKINTSELRNQITWARREEREYLHTAVNAMFEQGLNKSEISRQLGISDGTVAKYISGEKPMAAVQWDNVTEAVEDAVKKHTYLDVSVGVERQLGVSRDRFNKIVAKLAEDEGYHTHLVHIPRLNDPEKNTTIKVLTKESDRHIVNVNSEKIRPIDSWSDDRGISILKPANPKMVNTDRIKVRYMQEGGGDKDGLIELRPGVEDLDLGNSKYAQVRIGAGKDKFLKGMAVYADESMFPPGVDIIYNVTKDVGTPKEDTFKTMVDDPINPFGASVKQHGQKGALNLLSEEGDWDTWSDKMSTQFLSKQPPSLVKERLEATYKAVDREYQEILSLDNQTVKKYLLNKFNEGLVSKARQLQALGLPNTKNHVLLPVGEMNPKEIYAPRYRDGETVVLVRHPHGGKFEIPELIVNNKNAAAQKMMGNAPDAVAIHPSVGAKLSGADFDGDTVLVIPNPRGQVKTSRTLKELKNFDTMEYRVDPKIRQTIKEDVMQTQMGMVSNLISDMSVKGATQAELAQAVKHSMVVIDSYKHNLDFKQSARDTNYSALRKKWLTHVSPHTGKESKAASTIISRHKKQVKIDQPGFKASPLSSGTVVEDHYVDYIDKLQSMRNEGLKKEASIKEPAYSREAAITYAPERASLSRKLNTALLNAPRERQAQILTADLFYKGKVPGMSQPEMDKLARRSLAAAREATQAKRENIPITAREWEAIQAQAVSKTMLNSILKNTEDETVKKLATPKPMGMSTAMVSKAKSMLARGLTYADVAQALGVSTSTIREGIIG